MNDRNQQHIPPNAPNLYLVGFMGTGKSVVGQKIAENLNIPFLDSDKVIERNEGMQIPEIFEKFGEAHFRELERKFVYEDKPTHSTIISCGGGLVTNTELLEVIKSTGIVIVLYAGIETLLKRISGDMNRPLMKVDDPKTKIEELLKARESIYKQAGVGIMTDGHTITEVVHHVTRIYLEKIKNLA